MPDQVVIELAERGKALSPEERSRLVDLLLESLHEPATAEVEAAWEAEIDRRLAQYDRGEVQSIDAEGVFAKALRLAR
jgi:putative addiction module component (TIGR02574 family)